ncbi:hypothetical protein SUNI508_04560 [Seiridium unicorne]|uniref:Uncharacterized protein n=1 Tax=Seiridium unicorne TaxID=138068 RepID=A0ABR2V8F3_9PEZI
MPSKHQSRKGWPNSPQKPKNGTSRSWEIYVNVLHIISASLFFVFAALVCHSDGSPKTSFVQNLDAASQYGPTVYPVLYAIVVGSTVRSIGLWKLQAGAKINLLDLLFGSTSVGSTIITQFQRGWRLDLTTILLFGLWALSPLGGQASLRVVSYRDEQIVETRAVSYLDLASASYPNGQKMGDNGPLFDIINTQFLASLSAPSMVKHGPRDTWGNLKIPMIESFPDFNSKYEGQWLNVPSPATEVQYASMIGIPTSDIPDNGETNFLIDASYWTLDCVDFGYPAQYDDEYWRNRIWGNGSDTGCNVLQYPCSIIVPLTNDTTIYGVGSSWGWIVSTTSKNEEIRRCNSKDEGRDGRSIQKRQLSYKSINGEAGSNLTVANCSIQTSFVETFIACTGEECLVQKMRRAPSKATRRSTAWTVLDNCPEVGYHTALESFLKHLVDAADHQKKQSGMPGILQNYIQHPDRPFYSGDYYQDINLSSLDNTTFAERFAQLLNGYWSAFYAYNLTFEGHPEKLLPYSDYYSKPSPVAYANGTNARFETHFVYNRAWMAILIISTLVMFTNGILKLVLDLNIWIPELLMNVSTLLRGAVFNCPSFPFGGSAMDDSDRSRLLRDQYVRFGNIAVEDGYAGELGIGELAENEGRVTKVRRDMKYW